MWHLDDPAVRDAITRASQEESNEQVRARARSYLPKVEWAANRDEERAAGGNESDGEK